MSWKCNQGKPVQGLILPDLCDEHRIEILGVELLTNQYDIYNGDLSASRDCVGSSTIHFQSVNSIRGKQPGHYYKMVSWSDRNIGSLLLDDKPERK